MFIIGGAAAALLSVVFGAFGAHGLSGSLDQRAMSAYQSACQYQMYHALAMIIFGLMIKRAPDLPKWPGIAFALGIILFSGSLYGLSLTGLKFFGIITPFGGISFIAGWGGLCWLAATDGSSMRP